LTDAKNTSKRWMKENSPNLKKPDLQVENLNTVCLDILAQEDRYKSPTFWMTALSEEALD
jgi:hypothetical protein